MKGKLANGVGSQYSSHYLGTWCIQHYYRWCRTPRLPVVDWTDAPADLNGLVRFAERRNLVSARVPSHFNWPLTLKLTVYLPLPKSQSFPETCLHFCLTGANWKINHLILIPRRRILLDIPLILYLIKKKSSIYDCTVEDVEYICNSNSTLCLFYFAIFVVLLLP